MNQRDRKYLNPGRLQDVLTLIQVLGYGIKPRRTCLDVCKDIQDVEDNMVSEERRQHWELVAKSHSEFFRVAGKGVSISLIARHVAGQDEPERELKPETVHILMRTAIDLHDTQVQWSQRWLLYVPVWVAGIAGAVSIVKALIALFIQQ